MKISKSIFIGVTAAVLAVGLAVGGHFAYKNWAAVEQPVDPASEIILKDMPEQLSGTIYQGKLNNGNILLSSDNNGSGLWLYETDQQEYISIYSRAQQWKFFYSFGENECLISAPYGDCGLLHYDGSTVKSAYTTSGHYQFIGELDGKIFFISRMKQGLFEYDIEAEQVNIVIDAGKYSAFYTGENYLLLSIEDGGLLKVMKDRTEIILDDQFGFKMYKINDETALLFTNENTYAYNLKTKATTLLSQSTAFTHCILAGNDILLTSSYSMAGMGLHYYNIDTGTIKEVFSDGNCWTTAEKIGENIYKITGKDTAQDGEYSQILSVIYNAATHTVEGFGL